MAPPPPTPTRTPMLKARVTTTLGSARRARWLRGELLHLSRHCLTASKRHTIREPTPRSKPGTKSQPDPPPPPPPPPDRFASGASHPGGGGRPGGGGGGGDSATAGPASAGQPPLLGSSSAKAWRKMAVASANGARPSLRHAPAKLCCVNRHLESMVFVRTADHVQLPPPGTSPAAHSPPAGSDHHSPVSGFSVHWPPAGSPSPCAASWPT
mmetsp:Transcript_6622/g.16467  ORF Transcript_6622/g.16467 Transcript_6622/m.16467 type:complete len:211 (-) Transcript_6622:1024-1656(-)